MTLSPIIDSGWFTVCATINISLLRLYEEGKVPIEAIISALSDNSISRRIPEC
jgi:hypothetical protein